MNNIPEGYKQTEVGVIPEDWEVKTFGEICKVNQGLQIAIEERLKYPIANSKIYITIQYLNNGKDVEYINNYTNSVCCAEDDLLMTRTGNTGMVVTGVNGVFHNNFFKINFDKKQVDRVYLLYYLKSNKTKRIILVKAGTSTIPDLNHNDFYSIRIPLPPTIEEQTAIASALSDVDALITALEQLITKKHNIKQGTMQQLLTGKKRLPGFGGEWEVKKLRDCLTKNPDYGINAPSVPYSDNLPVYIRITDISDDGRFLPEKITSVDNINSNNYFLEKDDLVFARTGASTGKTYLYNPNDGKLVFAGFLIRVKVDSKKLDPRFLKSYTETTMYWNWVNIMSMRSGQPGINGNEFSQLSIPLPPLPEQQAIAQILSNMDTEIKALEQKRNKYKAIKQGMMQELLTGKTRLV